MRRFVAALMLVMFASLTAIDGICCPDGCTHGEEAPSTPSTAQVREGVCVLCVGGLGNPALEAVSPGVPVITVVSGVAVTNPGDVPPDPPEHPPRF